MQAMLECRNGPRQTYSKGRYTCEEYYNCRNGGVVQQCTVRLGTHDVMIFFLSFLLPQLIINLLFFFISFPSQWFDDEDFANSDYIIDFFGL